MESVRCDGQSVRCDGQSVRCDGQSVRCDGWRMLDVMGGDVRWDGGECRFCDWWR